MSHLFDSSDVLHACVDEVRPQLGLAFAVAEDGSSFGITRCSAGELFDRLRPGDEVVLDISHHEGAAVPLRCALPVR